METFYDGDLKDIWDSDLDPTESLKLSSETDMQDWFLERDVKHPVILNDKLISDALLNGTLPIKSEHSYSLNSDSDSLTNSPRSLPKMDDMEDECYPAISLKTATSNLRSTVDPKCLTLNSRAVSIFGGVCSASSLSSSSSSSLVATTLVPTNNSLSSNTAITVKTPINPAALTLNSSSNSIHTELNRITSTPLTFNLHNVINEQHRHHHQSASAGATNQTRITTKSLIKHNNVSSFHAQKKEHSYTSTSSRSNGSNPHYQLQHQRMQLNANGEIDCDDEALDEHDFCTTKSDERDGSVSPDICSDIEIDESCIKDEPMSPDSSCPPSPDSDTTTTLNGTTSTTTSYPISLSLANMAALTNSELVFENKNGCLQLTTSNGQGGVYSHQLILESSTSSSNQNKLQRQTNSILQKFGTQTDGTLNIIGNITNSTTPHKSRNGYGIPLTPPSSLSSDDSEGNLTPERLVSPLSPSSVVAISVSTAGTSTSLANQERSSTNSAPSAACLNRNLGNGSCTRQPIHTPLISSQPKGSTGILMLTEEEKRTLLAEGYPIPQKLPLTKAEEKSLKKIRRKIKNKISAQESRRKKKEYMDQLERRVEILANENTNYKKRVGTLEDAYANLLNQLHKLQAIVNKQNQKKT